MSTFLKSTPAWNPEKKETRIPVFFLLTKPFAGGFRNPGPQPCHEIHDGGHRRDGIHYTHEAEERNKIKFLILVESFINFIHLSSLLSSVLNLSWLRFLNGSASQGGIKQMLD